MKSANERISFVVFFGKTTVVTAAAGDLVLFGKLGQITSQYRKTLTRDTGSENKDWKIVEATLGLSVYVAHPCHSWERGSNENGNGFCGGSFPKELTGVPLLVKRLLELSAWLILDRGRGWAD